jgi:hypothetical protein
MKTRILKHALFALWALAAIAVVGIAVMLLWNWLMPDVFGLAALSFWQALGLLALARILFGGLGHKRWMGMHGARHNPISEKWAKMTPEEQKEFIRKRRHFFHAHHHHHFDDGCFWEKDHPESPADDAQGKQEK